MLIGVSGGADSVALTLLLLEVAPLARFTIPALAHVNHRMRPAADRDEAFCRQLAVQLGVPLVVESVDVPSYARAEGLSPEAAARRVRYAALHRIAAEVAADRIAVGHTQDDQAETFLLKAIRGAGATGLGGVYPRRGQVVRPLLDCSRAEIVRFLGDRGQAWVEDDTNQDLANPRNRIRHVVLPELDRAYGGPTRASLARTADLIREDGAWLDGWSERRFADLVRERPDGLEMDRAELAAEPPPVRRRVLRQALRTLSGSREIGARHVEAALAVLAGTRAGADLPGSRAERRGEKVVLIRQGVAP